MIKGKYIYLREIELSDFDFYLKVKTQTNSYNKISKNNTVNYIDWIKKTDDEKIFIIEDLNHEKIGLFHVFNKFDIVSCFLDLSNDHKIDFKSLNESIELLIDSICLNNQKINLIVQKNENDIKNLNIFNTANKINETEFDYIFECNS